MALVNTKEMFKKAFEGKYAVGAFNINNMEIIQGIVDGAKAQNSAVILQCSAGALKYMRPQYLKHMVLAAVEETGFEKYPIVLHGASSVDPVYVEMCNTNGGEIKGASGVPIEILRKASNMAVCKINMDTDIRLCMTGSCRKVFADKPTEFDPRKYLGVGRTNLQSLVEGKITTLLGSTDSMN